MKPIFENLQKVDEILTKPFFEKLQKSWWQTDIQDLRIYATSRRINICEQKCWKHIENLSQNDVFIADFMGGLFPLKIQRIR